jgi:hypothetical protein
VMFCWWDSDCFGSSSVPWHMRWSVSYPCSHGLNIQGETSRFCFHYARLKFVHFSSIFITYYISKLCYLSRSWLWWCSWCTCQEIAQEVICTTAC